MPCINSFEVQGVLFLEFKKYLPEPWTGFPQCSLHCRKSTAPAPGVAVGGSGASALAFFFDFLSATHSPEAAVAGSEVHIQLKDQAPPIRALPPGDPSLHTPLPCTPTVYGPSKHPEPYINKALAFLAWEFGSARVHLIGRSRRARLNGDGAARGGFTALLGL